MSQNNIKYSRSVVDLILTQSWERLEIQNLGGCCRVVSIDSYIKAECFSKPDNRNFRVIISIESISDEETEQLMRKQRRESMGEQ